MYHKYITHTHTHIYIYIHIYVSTYTSRFERICPEPLLGSYSHRRRGRRDSRKLDGRSSRWAHPPGRGPSRDRIASSFVWG